ncbi:MAG: TIGR02452 family protein [Clostridiales bacterium]|nr:TIGR02452 family protein [Clostridiales bacterium]
MGWNNREDMIQVFNDTMAQCRNHARLKDAVQKSLAAQRVYLEGETLDEAANGAANDITNKTENGAVNDTFNGTADGAENSCANGTVYEQDAQIVVSKKRSFEAASVYKDRKVCLLNFASATNPGGGVKRGSSAQEECLCRCSTLYPCISKASVRASFHDRHKEMLSDGRLDALYNDDCIYTPGVVVFKSDTSMPQIVPEKDWYTVDVITCAAPNLRAKPSNAMNPGSGSQAVRIKDSELKKLHEKRANRILDIAKANGNDTVILGAFQNPAPVVAAGIYEAVKQHRGDFRTIEFAVFCSPRNTENYEAFRRQFREDGR